ncbi:hypothetical protein ACLOJK_029147 [Asimina triloba]
MMMDEFKGIDHGLFYTFLLLLSLIAIPSLSSAFSTQEEDIEHVLGRSFDYIIVGGGTSGCPLAATLSQNYSVLLVERGGSPYGNPLIEDEENLGIANAQTDEFTSVSQEFISKEGLANYRGRALGGSTTINGGFYSRASKDYIKRAGWDPELVREAYEWVESKVVSRPSLSSWQSAAAEGMVEAGIRPFNGFTLEHIKGTKVGGSIFDVRGRRHTAADLLGAGNPEQIIVLLNATVQNIIFRNAAAFGINVRNDPAGGGKHPIRAHGIRFIRSNGDPNKLYEIYLNHPKDSGFWGDVILSAGALGSPQILMLSGIGPKNHLTHFNITTLIDAREVGQSVKDNPGIGIPLNYSSQSLRRLHVDPAKIAGIVSGFRIIIETLVAHSGFNTSDLMVLMAGKLAYPVSSGSLRLQTADPRQNPSVEFNYLSKEQDLDECVEMVRLLHKVVGSRSISTFLGRRQSMIGKNGTSSIQELRDFCRESVGTVSHYHGGCVVGSVIDRNYKVLGVKGLRVIDGSTFLNSPGTNPMATVLMLGRYQGVKMLREKF